VSGQPQRSPFRGDLSSAGRNGPHVTGHLTPGLPCRPICGSRPWTSAKTASASECRSPRPRLQALKAKAADTPSGETLLDMLSYDRIDPRQPFRSHTAGVMGTRCRGLTEDTVFHQVSKKAASASVAGSAAARTYQERSDSMLRTTAAFNAVGISTAARNGASVWKMQEISRTRAPMSLARSIRRPSCWPARIAWDVLRRARGSTLHSREEDYR
jgi:hypothetical protein